ncbi:MAG: hypothetical protein II973_02200 [Spirochaetaceae bacterium]|nr:hypothetical protein [Spirochaetaceae bacterium]
MIDNARLETFDMKNIPFVLDVVTPLWSPSVGDDDFKRFDVEYIIRNNIFENEYNFELVKNAGGADATGGAFLAAAFFARKGDINRASEWFAEKSVKYSDELKVASELSRAYIELMDKQTFGLMNSDDIKLSLFVSRERGAGAAILDAACSRLRAEGWKNLYLWTDCDCNWRWYEKHGFTLVRQSSYEPFSSPDEPYKTYIFKKPI